MILVTTTMEYPARAATGGADPDGSTFSFNGFGTLGVVHSSEDKADFVGNFFQPNGAGFTHRWSPGVDSKFGLQMDANFNDRISAVVQVVSQHQYDNSYKPQIEWANLKYQFTPDVSVRLGRTVSSLFMVSSSALVSYTYPWVRPPLEVYGQLPINHKDGIDVSYRVHVGDVTSTVESSYGEFTAKLAGGGKGDAHRFFDISETLERGPGTLRFAYSSALFTLQSPGFDSLFAGFTQFGQVLSSVPGLQTTGAQALSLANKYSLDDAPFSIFTIGASYDPGAWLLMAEWEATHGSASIPNATSWYVTGGYRIKKFTPYLTLARLTSDQPSEPGISTAGLPPELAVAAGALNSGLTAALRGFAGSQQSASVGIRWDFMRNADCKLEYERLRSLSDSPGGLTNVQPGFQPGGNVNLFSATVDFVF
jgi:hypothetical protein